MQEPGSVVAALVAPSREPSEATRSAIEAWVRDHQSSRAVVAIEAAAGAVLNDLLEDFGRTYSWNEVRRLPGVPEFRSMTDLAKRLRVISGRLREQHGADQVMQVHHSGRSALWLSFEVPPEPAPDASGIVYTERPVEMTWLGRLIYGRLPSRSRWSAPGVYPTLLVTVPFFLSLYGFYHGLFTANAWLVVLSMAIFANLVWVVFHRLSLPVNQAWRVEWPYVRGDGKFGVIHTRARSDGRPLFRLYGYEASCPICGDLVELEHGRHGFKGRIVGECRSNPMEHLFSFDHTTGEGRWLYER